MISRRKVLVHGLMAGAAGVFGREYAARASASQPATKVTFDVPQGATDCAVHVFGDTTRHPYWDGRTYTPEPATVAELQQVMTSLRLDRVVVVQATTYGTDNSCVVDSIRELGGRARGVAMIDEKTTEAALDDMHRGGVRGIRLNVGNQGATDPAAARQRVKAAADRMKKRSGWSLQVSATPAAFEAVYGELMAATVPLVIDHFGEPRVAEGLGQPGYATIINLVKSGRAYVKISNADNISRQPDLSDMTPYARALIAANPASRLGYGLAASERGCRSGPQVDRSCGPSSGRRWAGHEPAAGLGARRRNTPDDPGRQSSPALFVLGWRSGIRSKYFVRQWDPTMSISRLLDRHRRRA
jgi:predicted TIM-barrel fold metal-dependent hydrolase